MTPTTQRVARYSLGLMTVGILAALSVLGTGFVAVALALGGRLELPDGVLIVVAVATVVLLVSAALLAFRLATAYQKQQSTDRAVESDENAAHADFLTRVRDSALASEDAGRKLGTQDGETLSSITSISTEASRALLEAAALSDEVDSGASAMEQISATIESLGRQVQQQNSLVDQSAAAVEQMSASIQSVAEVAENKKSASDRLVDYTKAGSEKVSVSEQAIREVSERVEGVKTMLSVINTIAAQTNLLALNAAIEAAHAGSYGRGFAVVANEIRNLAESTSNQAREIGADLKELVGKIAVATGATDSAGEAFRTIEDEAGAVSAAFAEITASTQELAAGASEVVTASSDLRELSGQTAESSEEMKAGASELSTLLIRSRESAAQTRASMERINAQSGSITVASKQISELTRENNAQIAELLTLVGEMSDEPGDEPAAVRRLSIAGAILEHMGWVASLRSRLDGVATGAPLSDYPLLGWLDGVAADVLSKPTVDDLREHAQALNELALNAIEQRASDQQSAERTFNELLGQSTTVLERLSGQLQDHAMTWTPALSVHVDEFDAHHQKLFSLINKLYRAMKEGKAKHVLEQTFDELLEYTGYHFAAEERAFDEHDYPHAEEHRALHAEIVGRAQELRTQMAEGKQLVAIEVMEFLRDWITRHIKGQDMRYAPYLTGDDASDPTTPNSRSSNANSSALQAPP